MFGPGLPEATQLCVLLLGVFSCLSLEEHDTGYVEKRAQAFRTPELPGEAPLGGAAFYAGTAQDQIEVDKLKGDLSDDLKRSLRDLDVQWDGKWGMWGKLKRRMTQISHLRMTQAHHGN